MLVFFTSDCYICNRRFGLSSNLTKRGSTYYFRRVVPEDVQGAFLTTTGKPRREWVWSLRTKDRAEAKTLIPKYVTKTDMLVAKARAGDVEPPKAAVSLKQNASILSSGDPYLMTEEELEHERIMFWELEEHDERMENDPDYAARMEVKGQAARLRDQADNHELALQIKREKAEANQISLTDLFERYGALDGRNPKTIAQWKPYVRSLAKFIPHDDANALTHEEVVAWRNYLRDDVKYKGKPLAAKTINGSYLGSISALFAWAKGDGLVAKNPTLEVTRVKLPRQPLLRPKEFTRDEWRKLLSATLVELEGGHRDDFRNAVRWCPWLMAYSGARVGEVTQLRKQDIQNHEGIACMLFTPDAGSIKNKEARLVPLHSHLLEQGFLSFVEKRPDGPLFYDPRLRRSNNAINRQSNRLGSKLADWVKGLGITSVKPNHGWRHLFNTIGTGCSMDPRARLSIMGHSSKNVNDDYGSVPINFKAQELEKFPRFELVD
jgi:integrase